MSSSCVDAVQRKRQRSDEFDSYDDQTPTDDTDEVVVKRPVGFKMESNREFDDHRLEFRLKQISYGKNTVGYDNYITKIPKARRRGFLEHPRTPDAYERQSKRAFDGKIRVWRRLLHKWDNSVELGDFSQGIYGNKLSEIACNLQNKEEKSISWNISTTKSLSSGYCPQDGSTTVKKNITEGTLEKSEIDYEEIDADDDDVL